MGIFNKNNKAHKNQGFSGRQKKFVNFQSLCRFGLFLFSFVLTFSNPATAAIFDTVVSDVTTRAFSVVWVSDEPVADAKVKVFSDKDGLIEVTSNLSITLVSSAFPPALEQGIVKVDVIGLNPDTTVYVQTETDGVTGLITYPKVGALLEVRTASSTSVSDASNNPITNDLIIHQVLPPDGETAIESALILVKAPGISPYPLTAFVGQDYPLPNAAVDLNNFFSFDSGLSADVQAATILEIIEYRGMLCDPTKQKLVRFRKVPVHEETPPLTELESASACFSADTVCDETVNILDAQRTLNIFSETVGSCAYNNDLDLVLDGTINILDVQSVLNNFGKSAPF